MVYFLCHDVVQSEAPAALPLGTSPRVFASQTAAVFSEAGLVLLL